MRKSKNRATIRFMGSLADFVGGQQNHGLEFYLHPAAKDLIEAQGVPHVEVYALAVNGNYVPLAYNLQDGDKLEAYPRKEASKLRAGQRVRDPKECPKRFLADVHLAKLARLLRLLGIDTAQPSESDDTELVTQAVNEKRALLSRDLELLKHGRLDYGYWPRSTDPEKQVAEILEYFDLKDDIAPFTRCMKCNGLLSSVELEQVAESVPPNVQEWCSEYRQCRQCGQVYWKGSHFKKLVDKVNNFLGTDFSAEAI